MGNKYRYKPEVHKNFKPAVEFFCDYCGRLNYESYDLFNQKKRHFCNKDCYSDFRKWCLPKEEHNRFGSGHTLAERLVRIKCREILNHAIRDKKIQREQCMICGKNAEAYHPDYTKPLRVEWLCFKHHRQAHKVTIETPDLLKGEPKCPLKS